MSLWTPYAEEMALDLSKPSIKVERRPPSNSPPIGILDQDLFGYSYPQCSAPVPASIGHPAYYIGYQYPPQKYSVPVAQMSPVSGGSSCSGYETTPVAAAPLSPHFVPRAGPLSPPESPVSQAQRKSYTEVDELSDDPDFQAFERNALRVMAEKNGGALLGNNPRMRRAVRSTNQDAANDSYRKQRERNNFAAKQSRDRRKLREIHLALKVSYLKNEVASLKAKLAARVCGRCRQQCLC